MGLRRYLNTDGRPRYEEDEITLTGDNADGDTEGPDANNGDDHAMTGMMPIGPGIPAQVEIVQEGDEEVDEELEDGEGDGQVA